MIVGIHQPNYLPYLGFFDKVRQSDVFIIYDDAQFNKGDFQHRNRIRIYHGEKWLTVPVDKKRIPINEIKIRNDMLIGNLKWSESHLKEISSNYSKASYYSHFESQLDSIYSANYDMLVDLNMELIHFLCKSFGITTKFIMSSEFGFKSKSTEKIIELVKAVDGDIYLSGSCGADYMDIEQIQLNGIDLIYQKYTHPVYKQQYTDFIPYMSALDLLLNEGKLID